MLSVRLEELQQHLAAVHAHGALPHAMLIVNSRLADKEQVLEGILSLLYTTPGERIGNHIMVAPLPGDEKTKTKKDIAIEQIRELKSMLSSRAPLGVCRLITISPAQTLSTGAANSLLKMLEEPPARTHFVLLTDAWHDVPATILSRCEQYLLVSDPQGIYAACAAEEAQLRTLFGMPIYAQRAQLEQYLGDKKDHIAQRRTIAELFSRWYCAAGNILERMVRGEEAALADRGVHPKHVVQFMRMLAQAMHAIEHNVHPKLIFENVMVHAYAHI